MDRRNRPRGNHQHRSLRQLLVIVALVALGFSLAPTFIARAQTVRTATATGSGKSQATGAANAENNARVALSNQAAALGEVCTNVTSSSTLIYTSPNNDFVFRATASGLCSPPPPPPPLTVPRSATARGEGSTSSAAVANGEQQARAAILAAGGTCGNWSTSYTQFWRTPDGSWYLYDVTVSALCAH